jgi:NADP-dependent aldehyde dehydrogenase
MTRVETFDPRTGRLADAGFDETAPEAVAATCARAAKAAEQLAELVDWPQPWRVAMLREIADRIDGSAADLVAVADDETALGPARLAGEVARTTGQLRLFAAAVEEGSFLEVVIDHADPDAKPAPRPDLRRMLHPIGTVGVFSASNFPFAFSVAGGDTAAALAAGCPVIVKAHHGHPRTSAQVAELVGSALAAAGAPPGTFGIVYGRRAGQLLVTDPHIKAVGFTGSLRGGRALFDLAVSRPDPIPFYGELGSLNPVVVTAGAATARGAEIVSGFVGSFTLGAGQFCTKPGVLFLPTGHGLESTLAEAVAGVPPAPLLTPAIGGGFQEAVTRLGGHPLVRILVGTTEGDGTLVPPRVYATTAAAIVANPALLDECFGPSSLIVEYDGEDDLVAALDAVSGSLTATIHAEPEDEKLSMMLLSRLRRLAGRIIWNGWPTGVAVTWSMHHGGPWPATTNPLHTSVGVTAIRRFLVPVVYQNTPQDLLPEVLRDSTSAVVPRRVDGVMQTPP